jgi:murein DD-endopeptidase MepM/ murein hydrolase activator NlpD
MFASVLLAAACLLPPVDAPVADPFREPPCTWCPGNRGLTYRVRPGITVRAAAGGRVAFSGLVAGTRYVVVVHADGLRATYGGLSSSHLHAGDTVATGAVIGRSGDELHFGLRDGERYVDPEPLLGDVVHRARLVPADGTPPRPAPPPRLSCPGGRT